MPAPELLTAAEAATLLRVDVRRIQALARAGRLPGVRAGRRWLFARHALLATLGRSGAAALDRAGGSGAVAEAGPPTAGVDISARNQLRARVVGLTVDGLMAEVELALGDQRLVSVITRRAAERLGLAEGQEVLAVIKSTEIMVARAAVPAPDRASATEIA